MSTPQVAPTSEQIRKWVLQWLARELETNLAAVAEAGDFMTLGVSSRQAVTMTADLGDWLGLDLPPNLLFIYPDLASLVGFLSESVGERG